MIDAGMAALSERFHDREHGGYAWSVRGHAQEDGTKLAYGHAFVLLAGASAKLAGHPGADSLIEDIADTIERHFWDESHGLLRDEFARDWSPISSYRGMNANMHGAEAMLAAFEATDRDVFLDRAGRILDFFVRRIAPAHGQRLPEHYREDWTVDSTYQGNPMFRPAGSTPGNSFELGRLLLQHWDLSGRLPTDAPERARRLIEQAYLDAWDPVRGGLAYTLMLDGRVSIATRYWWPVTEAIGAYAALRMADPHEGDDERYRELWSFAEKVLIDRRHGGWFPELDAQGRPIDGLFRGKPDIYHSLQAALIPLSRRLSRLQDALRSLPS